MDESPSTSTRNSKNSDTRQYVWSNRKCIQIALEKSFPKDVKNLALQKNIITRFFNFYLGAKVHKQKGVSVSDLVFSTISIMPLHPGTEQFMWGDHHYDDEGSLFTLALEDKLSLKEDDKGTKKEEEAVEKEAQKNIHAENNDVPLQDKNNFEENASQNEKDSNDAKDHLQVNTTKTSTVNKKDLADTSPNTEKDDLTQVDDGNTNSQENNKNDNIPKQEGNKDIPRKFPSSTEIVWFTTKLPPPDAKAECKQYGPVENAAFTTSVNRFIELWDSDLEARIALKYFFGIVALTLLRGTTKTFKHLVNAFSNVRFVRNLDSIRAFASQKLKYSVPHKRCIKFCYRTFRKRDENLRVMFAKIVFQSLIINNLFGEVREFTTNSVAFNIMKVTVLAHTAGYGLGLISMIENLAKRELYFELIVETTRCKETEQSWEKITNFFEKYMTKATNEWTHFWARVIDENYFSELSCAENYPLAVILAVFIDKLSDGKDAGVWQSTWVKKGENLDAYKQIGQTLYLQYREKDQKKSFDSVDLFRKLFAKNVAASKETRSTKESSTSKSSRNDKNLDDNLFNDSSLDDDLFADRNLDDDLFADNYLDDNLFTDSNLDDDLFTDSNLDDDLFTDRNLDDDLFTDSNLDDYLFSDSNFE